MNSFIDVNEKRVLIAGYSFFRRRESTVPLSDISCARHVRRDKWNTEYIHAFDRDGKLLFYVLRTAEADRVFARFFDSLPNSPQK